MNKREIPVINVGVSLIILIFMNICLAAFAVLSLQNALSDYSLSQKTASHTTQYYAAVNKVQEQLAQKNEKLRAEWEEQQKTQSEIQITESVSKRQQLVVTLRLDETGTCPQYYIEKWQLCTPDDWQADDSLDVYKSGQ